MIGIAPDERCYERAAPNDVPSDAHFFRVEGWVVALIVSEAVKEAMERVGCMGAKFMELTM